MVKGNSGQALIITALVISLLIVSTFYYIYDVTEVTHEKQTSSLESQILMIKLGSVQTVKSSLANLTNGGNSQIVAENLEAWSNTLRQEFPRGHCLLNAYPRDTPPYNSGAYISWGNGYGISSCYVEFNLTIYGEDYDVSLKYLVNITSSVVIWGFYSQIAGNITVEVFCEVFNEGAPASAEAFTVYYQNGYSWLQPQTYTLTDYGNGTYRIAFNVDAATLPVNVSVGVLDTRQIYVQANATCSEA